MLREAVRESFDQLRHAVSTATGLDRVQVKTFMAYGMLLNTSAALDLAGLDAAWARQARTRVEPGLVAGRVVEAGCHLFERTAYDLDEQVLLRAEQPEGIGVGDPGRPRDRIRRTRSTLGSSRS